MEDKNQRLPAALFLDRDGVINHDPGDYTCRPEDWHLLDGITDVMSAYQRAGYRLVVVTNQGGIGLGRYNHEDLDRIHQRMIQALGDHGVVLDEIYACRHHPKIEPCFCRKPAPLLIQKALHRWQLDPKQCLMIGDRSRDVEAAEGAGVPGYLVPVNADLRLLEGPWQALLKTLCLLLILMGSLWGQAQAQTVVAQVFLDPRCPATQSALPALQRSQEKWAEQVHWIAVFSDSSLSEQTCLKYLLEHNLAMALRRDPRANNLRVYRIPLQPWILLTNQRAVTLHQGPLLDAKTLPSDPQTWEKSLEEWIQKPDLRTNTPARKATVRGQGCPVPQGPSTP